MVTDQTISSLITDWLESDQPKGCEISPPRRQCRWYIGSRDLHLSFFGSFSASLGLAQHFPLGVVSLTLFAVSVLVLLCSGEGLTRHFHFDKRPSTRQPKQKEEVKCGRKTNSHEGPLPPATSSIKQYLLYCTERWIWTETVFYLPGGASTFVRPWGWLGFPDTFRKEQIYMWRHYFIGTFNGTILMADILSTASVDWAESSRR